MFSRRDFATFLAAGAVTAATRNSAGAATDTPAIRNIVLVHGLFADGSCWSEVIARLQKRGLTVTSVQNPLTSLEDATDAVRRALNQQTGPSVLVGHSFAGTIISEVGARPDVASLVYVAARAPDAGEDYAALTNRFPKAPASAGITFDGDWGRLTERAFLQDFAQDVPTDRARVLFAAQEPFRKALTAARTTQAAWRSKPTFYAISANDRTINPDLQRFMAARMKAQTVTLSSSHLSMISHPDAVTALILRAAT